MRGVCQALPAVELPGVPRALLCQASTALSSMAVSTCDSGMRH